MWESRFCRWIDLQPDVLEWTSEEPLVPYLNPVTNTVWNYHPDFLLKLRDTTKQIGYRMEMVEIKPKNQTIPPVIGKKKKRTILEEQKTWAINQAKWLMARRFCEQRGWTFRIITEDQLFAS
jgi:hypothetical protein